LPQPPAIPPKAPPCEETLNGQAIQWRRITEARRPSPPPHPRNRLMEDRIGE
jgi:hypothetical protein